MPDKAIENILNMREHYNMPIWLGESGENSNNWFSDCISLMEGHNIGWSWWPMKRVETIVGPYSIEFTDGYKNISDILVESIKGFTLSSKKLSKRFVIKNPEVLDPFFEKKQKIFNSWRL